MKRTATWTAALIVILGATLGIPHAALAADQTVATAGAGGLYPSGTSFMAVSVSGLQLAFGAEVHADGNGLGNFTAVLLGLSAAGLEQNIKIQGAVTAGTRNAVNVAVLSGTATLDLGDGTPAMPGVPFTATLTTGTNNLGTVGLDIVGFSTLPNATLNAGSLALRTVLVE